MHFIKSACANASCNIGVLRCPWIRHARNLLGLQPERCVNEGDDMKPPLFVGGPLHDNISRVTAWEGRKKDFAWSKKARDMAKSISMKMEAKSHIARVKASQLHSSLVSNDNAIVSVPLPDNTVMPTVMLIRNKVIAPRYVPSTSRRVEYPRNWLPLSSMTRTMATCMSFQVQYHSVALWRFPPWMEVRIW